MSPKARMLFEIEERRKDLEHEVRRMQAQVLALQAGLSILDLLRRRIESGEVNLEETETETETEEGINAEK